MNGFDLSTVTNIYLGSTPVKEVYMGTKLIWSTGTFDYATEYLTIESLEDNNQIGIVDSDRPSISISKDKQTWTTVTPNAAPTYFITLNTGEKVYIKGSNNAYYDISWSTKGYFTSTGQFNVSGNAMSLIYADDFKNKTTLSSANAFNSLFYNANKLISAEHLVLPATTLTNSCYSYMFQGCASLTKAPELPATTIDINCYAHMFQGCASLTKAPELPATYLFGYCYTYMFYGCSSLTEAPYLPAFYVASKCYNYMFAYCSSLTTAPELPATNLSDNCYAHMFEGCTSLTSIGGTPFAFYETAPYCCESMFAGCTSLKQTIVLIPETLTSNCYANMFNGCTKLESVDCLATDISATSCTENWLNNVASYGVFSRDTNMHDWPTGPSGIPEGWEVLTT